MPKIDAPTVAEHHDLHHAKLLAAALGYVAAHDVESLTLAELAKRTGRSRASLYAYFGSADDLRAAVCAASLGSWVDALLHAVRQAPTPGERLERLVTLQIVGPHDPAVDRVLVFMASQQNEPFRTTVRSVTEPLTVELLAIIEGLGVDPPTRAATVVQGAVAAAHDQVRAGADPRRVADDTIAFVRAGLRALRDDGPPPDGHPPEGAGQPVPAHPPAVDRVPGLGAPGALAMAVAPSLPAMLASSMPACPGPPLAPARRRPPCRRAARVAAVPSVWAAIGSASGVTGVGGAGLHVLLGLSLVGVLAWSARAAAPARAVSDALRTTLVLAALSSAVALLAVVGGLDGAVVIHVALGALLLAGLARATRAAWRGGRAVALAPHPV